MPEQPPASIALTALGIPHRVFLHKGTVSSFEQAEVVSLTNANS
jgi:hypothetical protein